MPWTMMMGGFMYLLYDSMAYKLYDDDVERVERETGKPVRDLSEEELVAAMKRLRTMEKFRIQQRGKLDIAFIVETNWPLKQCIASDVAERSNRGKVN
jgi:hypothetical protein